MRFGQILLMTMLASFGSRGAEHGCLAVRIQGSIEVPLRTLHGAQLLVYQIFGELGIAIRWEEPQRRNRHPDCVRIEVAFDGGSPPPELDGALAFAMPYQEYGGSIRVYSGRILSGGRTGPMAERQLGYVMAHEIGHMLEGVNRHSDSGIMKAVFPGVRTLRAELRFAPEDVLLIRAGMARLKRSGRPGR